MQLGQRFIERYTHVPTSSNLLSLCDRSSPRLNLQNNFQLVRFASSKMAKPQPVGCPVSGSALLQNPHYNKGTAHPASERNEFELSGLLPARIHTLEEQVKRAYQQYQTHRTPLGKNTFMTSMKEQNLVLYYRLIQENLKDMFPIIYTPTEGDAIANYSRIFRQSEGVFLNIEDPDSIESALAQWRHKDVDIIACSDGEQILGRSFLLYRHRGVNHLILSS